MWQPSYYNLLTDKKDKKIHVFEVLIYFFWKYIVTISLKKFSSNTISSWYNFGKYYIVIFNYLVEDLIQWKRCFEIFLMDHCASDIANKKIAGKHQNILVSVSSTRY